jgi:hypothetical protein
MCHFHCPIAAHHHSAAAAVIFARRMRVNFDHVVTVRRLVSYWRKACQCYFALQKHCKGAYCVPSRTKMSLPSSSFYSCIYLDATARQAARAVCHSFRQLLRNTGSRHLRSARACEKQFGDNAVMCLSVRSAFDALLTTCNFPKGSHVIMSGEMLIFYPAFPP